MKEQDRKTRHSTRHVGRVIYAISLILLAAALISPSASLADVGDQYLPQIPDAGGKKDESGTGAQTAVEPTTTTATSASKDKGSGKKQKSDDSEQGTAIAAVPPNQGGGPGTGAVIALSLLGVALVGAVLWLVSRGRRSLAEAEQGDTPRHHPDTPRGEITGDGSTRNR